MDDDDFGADADFLAALAASDVETLTTTTTTPAAPRPGPPKPPLQTPQAQPAVAHRPTPQRIQQPTPRRIEKPGVGALSGLPAGTRIVQPTPQVLPGPPGSAGTTAETAAGAVAGARAGAGRATVQSSGSSILVSPRQKNNPVLSQLRTVPWEYSDIVADYGLGTTTCALFLSLKYHRLHPEYIYSRIQGLQGKFQLRVLLALVDIDNHEEPLRELAKTSLVNQVTLVLCWSAAEAARYLELYKSFEHATSFAAIRGQQAAGYAECLVQFATVPRAINKADAVALVSSFGSLRRAVLADPDELALVQGWGKKKVQGWRRAVEAPFRVQKTKARRAPRAKDRVAAGSQTAAAPSLIQETQGPDRTEEVAEPAEKPAEKLVAKPGEKPAENPPEQLSDGVAAALARLRDGGKG